MKSLPQAPPPEPSPDTRTLLPHPHPHPPPQLLATGPPSQVGIQLVPSWSLVPGEPMRGLQSDPLPPPHTRGQGRLCTSTGDQVGYPLGTISDTKSVGDFILKALHSSQEQVHGP